MRIHLAFVAVLLLSGAARAEEPRVEAAVLLSRYPAGSVPVDPTTMTAIQRLGEEGTRQEISLLRNLAEHERDEVRAASVEAIAAIRARQRAAQREAFAGALPDWDDLATERDRLRGEGLGREEADCVAYAATVLGPPVPIEPVPAEGDPETLLAEGRPRLAMAALKGDLARPEHRIAAVAWEDVGEPKAALQHYAVLAAGGDDEAAATLDAFGVDAERLLLGLLVRPEPHLASGARGELLEVLVRRGGYLTVEVLTDRSAAGPLSERLTATDALGRMLDIKVRTEPLDARGRTLARRALIRATRAEEDSIRSLAVEAVSAAQ